MADPKRRVIITHLATLALQTLFDRIPLFSFLDDGERDDSDNDKDSGSDEERDDSGSGLDSSSSSDSPADNNDFANMETLTHPWLGPNESSPDQHLLSDTNNHQHLIMPETILRLFS